MCPICVASHPALSEACQAQEGTSEPPGPNPSLHPPRPRRGEPRTLSAARPPRPAPVAAAPQAGLASTHGDPGPRAAAAEGTSGPGRPAGAERQAKGRGPGRAGEVARPNASSFRHGGAEPLCARSRGGNRGHVARSEPTAKRPTSGRAPAPDSRLGEPAQWPLAGRGCGAEDGACAVGRDRCEEKQEAPHGSAEGPLNKTLGVWRLQCLGGRSRERNPGSFLEPARRIQIEKVTLRLS